jgi:hypothetical protein
MNEPFTGEMHQRAAQNLLANLRRELPSGAPLHTTDQQARMIAEAQAHATLALVFATRREATR